MPAPNLRNKIKELIEVYIFTVSIIQHEVEDGIPYKITVYISTRYNLPDINFHDLEQILDKVHKYTVLIVRHTLGMLFPFSCSCEIIANYIIILV